MKKLFTIALAMASLLMAPSVLRADDCDSCCETTEGMYLGVFGGFDMFHDVIMSGTGYPDVAQAEVDFGYIVGGLLGYRCCNGVRVEFELAWREHEFDDVLIYDGGTGVVPVPSTTSSKFTALSYMFNVIYECVFCACDLCFRPYFGFGLGGATVDAELVYTTAPALSLNEEDTVFAYQLIMGMAYPLNDCVEFAVQYRFFSADEPSFDLSTNSIASLEWLKSHSVTFDVRYMFGSLW